MKKPSPQRQQEIIIELANLVDELGWVIALPTEGDTVPGLIIGSEEFAKEVTKAYYGDAVDLFSHDENGELKEMSPEELKALPMPKKGVTWH